MLPLLLLLLLLLLGAGTRVEATGAAAEVRAVMEVEEQMKEAAPAVLTKMLAIATARSAVAAAAAAVVASAWCLERG